MKKTISRRSQVIVPCIIVCATITGQSNTNNFVQPPLPYAYNALEPHIDAQTMEIHYSRHHAAYTKNFNDLLQSQKIQVSTIEDLFSNISKYPAGVRNNGGGFYNHIFYWESMSPDGGGAPTGKVAEAIKKDFGSFDTFKEEFAKAGMARFGSGWAWLIVNKGKLSIVSTPNQDNPLMDIAEQKGTPILCVDVWEHAYYLKYQNKRADYLQAFWNVVNWKKVEELYQQAIK